MYFVHKRELSLFVQCIFVQKTERRMGVGLVYTSNYCCIHLKWISFSSDYLYKQGQLSFFGQNQPLFSSLGTFEQKKKQANSDHTDASE